MWLIWLGEERGPTPKTTGVLRWNIASLPERSRMHSEVSAERDGARPP
jgi:hypothetical protein